MEQIKRRRLSAKERKQVFDMYNGHCAYCGTEITFRGMQVDHKQPLRIGGEDALENMFPACRSCNHYKATLDIEKFREYLEGIPKRVRRDDIAFQVGERYGLTCAYEIPVKFYFEKSDNANCDTGREKANA